MSLTPLQIQCVQSTFEQVAPIAEQAAQLFYGRLFEIAPEVKPLFQTSDMKEQGKKLMDTLAVVARGLNRLDALMPAVTKLGARHQAYGVRDEHYAPVGQALLWTLEQGLGSAFTPEVKQAWAEAYAALASAMKAASRGERGAA